MEYGRDVYLCTVELRESSESHDISMRIIEGERHFQLTHT